MPIKTKKVEREFTHVFRDGSTANYEIKITYKNAPPKKAKKVLLNNNNNNDNNYNVLISQMLRKRKMALKKQHEKKAHLNMLERKRAMQKKQRALDNLNLHRYMMRTRPM